MVKLSIASAIGAAVKRRRQELQYSQIKLSIITELHRSYISDIERGYRNMSVGNLVRLAKGLRTLPSILLIEAEKDIWNQGVS